MAKKGGMGKEERNLNEKFLKSNEILSMSGHLQSVYLALFSLREYCTPNQKLACLVLNLKIINAFWKMIYASYSKLSKELKNSIKI